MSKKKIIYRNWLADVGFDPREGIPPRVIPEIPIFTPLGREAREVTEEQVFGTPEEQRRASYIREQVAIALAQLTDDEREFVERYYLSGQTYREISQKSGRACYKLEALHRRAVRRLRKLLGRLAHEIFEIKGNKVSGCPICESKHRAEIDELILERDREGSWKAVALEIRQKFGVEVYSAMTLIGHEKYH